MTFGVSVVLMVIGGGTAAIAQLTEEEPRIVTAAGADRAVAPPAAPSEAERVRQAEPDRAVVPGKGKEQNTAAREPMIQPKRPWAQPRPPVRRAKPEQEPAERAEPEQVAQPPRVTTRTESERRAIPFRTRLVRDPSLPRGSKRVQSPGVPGEQLVRYAVTLTDGRPTGRRVIDAQVTRQPQHRVVAFGTGRGNNDCRDDRCGPGWRTAGCERTTESTEAPLTVEDLKGVELQPGMLC
jgi:surface rod structure-forming protein G